ncbi:hypothetical protein ANANG_G00002060 [Anguilla anguilla]|uniref:Uncharacterized protein n=1 Tax=Anguilla anguilla TaxID=7936 RepID=A0A9D3MVN8_ANGAN|nr:hypothetical protein ANANG_G00002060 [Anguilla anguilla]
MCIFATTKRSARPYPNLSWHTTRNMWMKPLRSRSDILIQYHRTLLVADSRRCKSNKFGGPGACTCYQKSYC